MVPINGESDGKENGKWHGSWAYIGVILYYSSRIFIWGYYGTQYIQGLGFRGLEGLCYTISYYTLLYTYLFIVYSTILYFFAL